MPSSGTGITLTTEHLCLGHKYAYFLLLESQLRPMSTHFTSCHTSVSTAAVLGCSSFLLVWMSSVSSSAVLVTTCQTVFYITSVWILLISLEVFLCSNTNTYLLASLLALWPVSQGTIHFSPVCFCRAWLSLPYCVSLLFKLVGSFWNFWNMLTHKKCKNPLLF